MSATHTLRRALLIGCLAVGTSCASNPPRRVTYIAPAPPRGRVEVLGAAPGREYVWVAGHWAWRGREYEWIPGRWDHPAAGYRSWVPGRWVHNRHGWYYDEGHWRR